MFRALHCSCPMVGCIAVSWRHDIHGSKAISEWTDPMVKDVMVYLDGTADDELRLAAVTPIVVQFEGQVIGLFLNPLPAPVAVEADAVGAARAADLLEQAKQTGDRIEAALAMRLARLNRPVEIRRFDILAQDIADLAAREARSVDAFVALRPNGSADPERMVEAILLGSGRHLLLVPEADRPKPTFDRILVAWNGSRESARALAEAMPYLHKAHDVTVTVITDEPATEERALLGSDAVDHLRRHGIEAVLNRTKSGNDDVGARLIAEAERQEADLIVMGGYGHSRLREILLGGVTYALLHEAPVPLLMAH